MDLKVFAMAFGAIFLAELGDKTQLAAILMTAKTGRPIAVFIGASLALVLVTLIGVIFAQALVKVIPGEIIKKLAAAGFVAIGVLMFMDKV